MLLREEKDRSEDLAYKHQEQSHIVLELTKELDKLREDYRSE